MYNFAPIAWDAEIFEAISICPLGNIEVHLKEQIETFCPDVIFLCFALMPVHSSARSLCVSCFTRHSTRIHTNDKLNGELRPVTLECVAQEPSLLQSLPMQKIGTRTPKNRVKYMEEQRAKWDYWKKEVKTLLNSSSAREYILSGNLICANVLNTGLSG